MNSELRPWIAPDAIVPDTARVFPNAWIGSGVTLGQGVVVGPGAVLGYGPVAKKTLICANTQVGPGVHIEPGVEIGEGCMIGSGTVIRDGTRIGEGVGVGIHCTLMGHCHIAEHAVLSSEVYICEYAELRPHCQILPRAILLCVPYPPTDLGVAGPVIGECSIVCTNAVIWPGVKIGYHALVAAASEVKQDVADYMLVRGCPATVVCDVRKIRTKVKDQWLFPYPWMRQMVPGEDLSRPAVSPERPRKRFNATPQGDPGLEP